MSSSGHAGHYRPFVTSLATVLLAIALLATVLSACSTTTPTSAQSSETPTAPAGPLSTPTLSASTSTPAHGNPTPTHSTTAPSLQATELRYTFGSIAVNTASPVTAISCPNGYFVASAGLVGDDGGMTVLMQDVPMNSTSWSAQVYNGFTQAIQPVVGLECVKATGENLNSIILTQSMGTIAPQSASGIVQIDCPSGYIASGGGFSSTAATYTVMNNVPSLSNSARWLPEVYNTGTSPITVTAEIVCFSAANLKDMILQGQLNKGSPLLENTMFDINLACPNDYFIGGGGLDSGYSNLYEPVSGPNGNNQWYESMFYEGPGTAFAQVDIVCLRIG